MRSQQTGFTLVELMVAVAIFSFLSLASYQMLQSVLSTDKQAQAQSERLAQLSRALLIIGRDINQALDRPVREQGQRIPHSFTGGLYRNESDSFGLSLLRLGWSNPRAMLPRSELQKVEYSHQQGELIRRHFYYSDTSIGDEGRTQVLLAGLEGFKLRFLVAGEWREELSLEQFEFPNAVELTLEFTDNGSVRRLFMTNDAQKQDNS